MNDSNDIKIRKTPDKECNPLDETQKRPWLSVSGLLVAILSWIAIFAFPKTDLQGLHVQLYVLMFVAAVSIVMSFVGRRQAPALAVVGMITGGALLLFLVLGLIGIMLTD